MVLFEPVVAVILHAGITLIHFIGDEIWCLTAAIFPAKIKILHSEICIIDKLYIKYKINIGQMHTLKNCSQM